VKFELARYVHRLRKSAVSARKAGRPLILAFEELINVNIHVNGEREDLDLA